MPSEFENRVLMRAAEFRLWLGRAVWVALLIWGFGGGNAQDAICIQDEDCPAGQYCFSDTCDSGEGWQHPCSRCVPCDTCQCNADSLAGACPKSRCVMYALVSAGCSKRAPPKISADQLRATERLSCSLARTFCMSQQAFTTPNGPRTLV